jgi:hypothetical protein
VLAVNVTGAFLQTVVLEAEMETVGLTAGETATIEGTETVFVPPAEVTCRVAAYEPGDVYTTVG